MIAVTAAQLKGLAMEASDGPRQSFRLFDSICLIVGIIVGAGIYETAPSVASSVNTPLALVGLWALGGFISLLGALCYTELAAAFPEDGGDFVYLSRAYGRWAGFLFGWMQLAIVRPGDLAAMAFVFATYSKRVLGPTMLSGLSETQLASLAVIVFTGVNLWGVSPTKWTQNLMTVAKLLGFACVILVGWAGAGQTTQIAASSASSFPLPVAMVLILFCYGGWNEMAYIAAEIEKPQTNVLRAMVGGLGLVAVLYVLANSAFLAALGLEGMSQSSAVAVDVVATRFPGKSAQFVGALIALSALGSLNGLILTGARVSYSAGAQHALFRWFGNWNESRQAPSRALWLQMVISLVLINLLKRFDDTVIYTASTVYTFYFFSTLSVIVLRYRMPDVARPFRVIGYPWTVLLFGATCVFMMYSTITYRPVIAGYSLLLLVAGVPLFFLSQWMHRRRNR